jgi:hypothetical protein
MVTRGALKRRLRALSTKVAGVKPRPASASAKEKEAFQRGLVLAVPKRAAARAGREFALASLVAVDLPLLAARAGDTRGLRVTGFAC